ncbi:MULTISPECIES: type 1 glutamine amidotransferase domain-containing protein [Pseudofrankia]|uniref:type 1 glutamine amidotransferase domain-containing protein n=1 Tax=Pseudofrankia TaxID=2994363 RepID=UPI000234D93B|nr:MULTISPECIES: type 1 glutamine amidotransferase domain-containing protein [Pseudofrankia]OHV41690.1 dihydroxyacetone kinase [Pseudofrankia sp. EUN1h]
MAPNKRILIALTSHSDLGATGRGTGFYVSEAADPWQVFRAHGYEVDLVSTAGGEPPRDGVKPDDPTQRRFLTDPDIAAKLRATPTPDQLDPAAYDAILYAGGHGTMWDFPGDTDLAELARRIYEDNEGVIAAVCHGPAGLVNITLSNGRPLVEGKSLAAFTNDEEHAVGLADTVPFLLQSRLEDLGAKHLGAPNFAAQVVVDGRLVTGQNPASATGVAEKVIEVLAGRP